MSAKLSKILAEERDSDGTNLDLFALRASSDWSINNASTHGQHIGSHCELRTSERRLLQKGVHTPLLMVSRPDSTGEGFVSVQAL
jgi:hypothetical protein